MRKGCQRQRRARWIIPATINSNPAIFSASGGRAGIATSAQQQDQKQFDLNNLLLESQIGLNQSKSIPGAGPPLTDSAKLRADFEAGRISEDIFNARRNDVLTRSSNTEFANTQKLRGEFRTETKEISSSLASLGAAQSLIATDANPIAQFAAFISTIKSIDNSTVREGELRAFERVQGLRRELDNFLKRAEGEGMTVDLRRDISETINKLQAPLNELLTKKRKFFGEEAERFSLRPESVSGSPFASVAEGELDFVGNAPAANEGNEIEQLKAKLAELDAERERLRAERQ